VFRSQLSLHHTSEPTLTGLTSDFAPVDRVGFEIRLLRFSHFTARCGFVSVSSVIVRYEKDSGKQETLSRFCEKASLFCFRRNSRIGRGDILFSERDQPERVWWRVPFAGLLVDVRLLLQAGPAAGGIRSGVAVQHTPVALGHGALPRLLNKLKTLRVFCENARLPASRGACRLASKKAD
jgi:hypothetical protein